MHDSSELPPARRLVHFLEQLYEQALGGIPGADRGVENFAQSYRAQCSTEEGAINALISWQIANAGIAGFVTNVGGVLTLPITIPANVVSVLYLQIRMSAAIAYLRGYDLRQDQVRSFVFACLAGSAAFDILKDIGIKAGTQLTKQAVMRISGEVLRQINQAVGFRLVTKAGSRGLVNLVKIIPVVSGGIGGALDAFVTKAIAETAKKLFVRSILQ